MGRGGSCLRSVGGCHTASLTDGIAVQVGAVRERLMQDWPRYFLLRERGSRFILPPMSRAIVNAHAATLPGATRSDPWDAGHDAWKVGGTSGENGVSVKCADIETAPLLVDMGRTLSAPYFHKSRVRIPWELVGDEERRERITLSHGIILRCLPKRVQALFKA